MVHTTCWLSLLCLCIILIFGYNLWRNKVKQLHKLRNRESGVHRYRTGLPACDNKLFEGNPGARQSGTVQVGGQSSACKNAREHVLHLKVCLFKHRPVLGHGYRVRPYELVHGTVQHLGIHNVVVFVSVLCVIIIPVVFTFHLSACLASMPFPRVAVSLVSSKRTFFVGGERRGGGGGGGRRRRRRRRTGSASLETRPSLSPAHILPQNVLHQPDPLVIFTSRGAICRRRVVVLPAASTSQQRLCVVVTSIVNAAAG